MSTTAPPVSSVPVALGRARLPRVDRTVLLALALAGALGLALGLAGLGGVDDAAHRYQASVFSVDGWTAWDNYWYAGRYGVVNYSLLFYPLAAVFGVVTVAVLATTASSGLFALIVMHQWGRPARWSALLFARLGAGAAGRRPVPVRARHGLQPAGAARRAARPAVAARRGRARDGALEPARVRVPGRHARRPPARRRPRERAAQRAASRSRCARSCSCSPPRSPIYQAFPGGGPFPYPAADLIGITAFALCGVLLARGSQLTRPLAGLFLAYLAIAWWAKLFPSPLGGNATRVLDYAGRAAARARDRRARTAGARARRARAHGRDRVAGGAVRPERGGLVRRAGPGGLVLAARDLVPAPARAATTPPTSASRSSPRHATTSRTTSRAARARRSPAAGTGRTTSPPTACSTTAR